MIREMWTGLVLKRLREEHYLEAGSGFIAFVFLCVLFAPLLFPLWCLGYLLGRACRRQL